MKKDEIIKCIHKHGVVSNMMLKNQIYGVMHYLNDVLESGLEGDIVELGCNVGTTSLYIRRLLEHEHSDKFFHVYDSWKGLPDKRKEDIDNTKKIQFRTGSCKTTKDRFVYQFNKNNLKVPIIHSGWFKEIPDEEYPEKICFAFLDGDFYSSIMDSLDKIYHKMVKGGIIIIDDCGWDVLPGCKKAVEDFLNDKKESLEHNGYPDIYFNFGQSHCGGKIVKL